MAPEFTLPAVNDEDVNLLELVGKCIVLVFFPQTFTTFSTMEIRQFVQQHIALQTLDATVIGISVEPVEALKTFAQQENIPFLLLSDFERKVAKAYGVYAEEISGFRSVALPAVFIISRKQRILYRWISKELDELPDLDKVMSVIHSFDPEKDIC